MTKKPFNTSAKNNNQYRIQFDAQEYLCHLEGMELSDAQSEAVLETLWNVMVQFVDLGFQMDFELNQKPSPDDTKPRDTNTCYISQRDITKEGEGP